MQSLDPSVVSSAACLAIPSCSSVPHTPISPYQNGTGAMSWGSGCSGLTGLCDVRLFRRLRSHVEKSALMFSFLFHHQLLLRPQRHPSVHSPTPHHHLPHFHILYQHFLSSRYMQCRALLVPPPTRSPPDRPRPLHHRAMTANFQPTSSILGRYLNSRGHVPSIVTSNCV